MLPILYSFRRCPYAMRARMALIRAGFCVEIREVALRDKPDQMLAISPKGTVPVLQLVGEVIDESLDIMRHVLDWKLSEQESHWVRRNDKEFKAHLDRYKYANRYEEADPLVHREAAASYLRDLDAAIRTGLSRPLSDALFPFVRQFANHDRSWFDAQPWSAVHHWLSENLDSEAFCRCMSKFTPWREGDSPICFP